MIMRLIKKTFLVVLTSVFFNFLFLSTYAQDTTMNFIISGVPQYMIISGMRFDFEKRIGNTDHWIGIGPQLYLREKNPDYNDYYYDSYYDYSYYYDDNHLYDMMAGYGIDVYHKIFMGFLEEKTGYSGTYLAYGLTFHNFFFNYKEQGWETYEEDGMEYMRESGVFVDKKRVVYKMGFNILFGYQVLTLENVLCDVYVGAGMRYSLRYPSYVEKLQFNNSIIDYGYTGAIPVAGFRLGVLL